MTIILNGEETKMDEVLNVSGLLIQLGFDKQPVLVEHNGNALHPREFGSTELANGDRIELIRIVAGG